jgi:hypothetical protein
VLLSAAVLVAGAKPYARAAEGSAGPLVFAVVVGNNDGLNMLPQLRYADDDALRFYRLAVQLASERNVALLTELDVDTWRRIQLSRTRPPPYLPPTKKKLLEVLDLFKQQIARARLERPDRPVHFYFFFSGHGERGYFFLKKEGDQLADSAFTGGDIERAFADSRATLNGLFIDACKSQSLFVTKGKSPGEEELGPDFSGLIDKLDRSARTTPIGVLTSTVSDQPAGEARDIRGGYFSHVLTSGMSGAADANSDGIVRYDELVSFVSFHTRRIAGQRPWFRPPNGRLDEPMVVLKNRRDLLEIPPGLGGHFAVFDGGGLDLVAEVNKSEAQWTRLILAPAKYRVIWVRSPERGLLAEVDLRSGPRRLAQLDFDSAVPLGMERIPKGEGLGAPPDPEDGDDAALRSFDPAVSGFDQPFTPRVVSALIDAYQAGRATVPGLSEATPSARRHFLSAGYGYFSPPVDPLQSGQGLTVAYGYRPGGHWPRLGARALLAFSDHTGLGENRSFRMQRLALQAEAAYSVSFGRRLELSAGAYVGWQMALVTRDTLVRDGKTETERKATTLSGDPAGLRTGLLGAVRLRVAAGLWVSADLAWGLELVREETDTGDQEAQVFLRPQVFGQVGYDF